MPTSSQALLLQHSSRDVQPMFGRHLWRPDLTYRYYAPSIRTPRQTRQSTNRRFFLRRTESAPNLRLDFASLPELLKIHGLHGAITYEKGANLIGWRMPMAMTDQQAIRAVRQGWTLAPTLANISPNTIKTRQQLLYFPEFRRKVRFQEDFDKEDGHRKPECFVKMDFSDETDAKLTDAKLTNAESGTSYFFRLVKNEKQDCDEEEDQPDKENKNNSFRLVRAFPSDPGVFRLARLDPEEEGDYQLIPPIGYESDDFRLVETSPGQYRLLQTDPYNKGHFKTVEVNDTDKDFKLVQVPTYEDDFVQTFDGETTPGALLNEDTDQFEHGPGAYQITREGNFTNSSRYNEWRERHMHMHKATEHRDMRNTNVDASFDERYHYFDDVIPEESMKRTKTRDLSLPDITLYDSNRYGLFHKTPHREEREGQQIKEREGQHMKEMDMNSYDTEMEEFRAKFGQCVRDNSDSHANEMGEFPTEFESNTVNNDQYIMNSGMEEFRTKFDKRVRGKDGVTTLPVLDTHAKYNKRKVVSNADGAILEQTRGIADTNRDLWERKMKQDLNYRSSEWKTHSFEEWSRTTDALPQSMRSSENRKQSLIDEVKLKANYKQWKKNKIANVRLRKDSPTSDRKGVCLKLRDNVLTHERLKQIVEGETGVKLASLQFDPVSVHSLDSDARSQWILRFQDESVCKDLLNSGIQINGVHYNVRSFDAVAKEEHEAYKLHKLMMQIKGQKMQSTPVKERRPRRQTRASQTQTQPLTLLAPY